METDVSKEILSSIIGYMKYAKYDSNKKRRETWTELIDRSKEMFLRKFPNLANEIEENFRYVYDKKVLPSMRLLQFAGKPIELNETRLFNCSYMPIDNINVFPEIMFLLLSGTGVGYSVQKHDVAKLPLLKGPVYAKNGIRKRKYLIGDSIIGWASAIKELVNSYFYAEREIEFDYRDIRPKGAHLVTSGGKAPGPQPLKDCIHNIRKVFDNAIAERGVNCKLKPIEVHDVACHISDAVLAGGIRRAACISLFSFDDDEMLTCKYGNWWETNPQRGRANNSVVMLRHKIKKEEFFNLWKKVELSGSGEPGLYLSNDKSLGANPCNEASLKPNSFCNLTTINVGDITEQEEFNKRCRVASFLGTLQASYTNFHFLREEWANQTEKDALLGVSMTGVASGIFLKIINLSEGAKIVLEENSRIAKILGINKAARTTLCKPEGTTSLICGTSSGIHAWHSPYYIRRVRVGKNEAIYKFLTINCPEILEDDVMNSNQAIMKFPIKAPEGAIYRDESPLDLLARVKKIHDEWIVPGHRKGSNHHNTSVTVSIKENEWQMVGEWLWENRESYNGISVLPFDGGSYVQAPFTECTKEEYEELYKSLHSIDLSCVYEEDDNTDLKGEIACGGGACTIT